MAERRAPRALTATVILMTTWTGWMWRRYTQDDGFIVLRYVEEVRCGHGWVFNPGQHWDAATSALHTILLVPLAFLPVDLIVSAHVLDWSLAGAAAVMLARLLWAHYPVAAIVAPFAVLLVPGMGLNAGLETYLLLATLALFVFLEERGHGSWAVAGLMALVRPDGAILGAVKFGVELVRTRRVPWRGAAIMAAVVAPWEAFSFVVFRSLIPQTAAVKAAQGSSRIWGTGPIYAHGVVTKLRADFGSASLLLLVAWFAAVGVATVAIDGRRWLLYPAAILCAQQAAYLIANPPLYGWYLVPAECFLVIYAAIGVDRALRPLASVRLAPLVLGTAAVLLMFTAWAPRRAAIDPRQEPYTRLAHRLDPSRPVGIAEPGTLAYRLPATTTVIDIAGVTTPNPPDYTDDNPILQAAPQTVALRFYAPTGQPVEVERALYEDPRFAARYRQAEVIPMPSDDPVPLELRVFEQR